MLIEFGKFPGYNTTLSWNDISTICQQNNLYSLNMLKDKLEPVVNHKFKKFDDFIRTFFPDAFADYFEKNLSDFSKSQFMNYDTKELHTSLAFTVSFWNQKPDLKKIKKKHLPPDAVKPETALENMMSFLNQTIDKTEAFFANTLFSNKELVSILEKNRDDLNIFKSYDTLIDYTHTKNNQPQKDERLFNGFNTFLAVNPVETFARLLLTVALERFLFPQREKNNGNFTFMSKSNLDPQEALKVLWFTRRNGSHIMTYSDDDISENQNGTSESLDIKQKDARDLSLANIALSSEKDYEEGYKLLASSFGISQNRTATEISEAYLQGMLKLAECVYEREGYNEAYKILEKYSTYNEIDGSYYLFLLYKERKNKDALLMLEKSAELGNEKAILDLVEAYISGDNDLQCPKDLNKAFEILENGIKNDFIKTAKGHAYILMAKICSENPDLGNTDVYVKKAKIVGYSKDSFLFNKLKKSAEKTADKVDTDFYFINSDDGANLHFTETVNTDKAEKITSDFNFDKFESALTDTGSTSLVASFMSDDEEKNIFDCIGFINSLYLLNKKLSKDESHNKKTEINQKKQKLSDTIKTISKIDSEKAKSLADKVSKICKAIENPDSIKLGQSVLFKNLIKETSSLFKNTEHQGESINIISTFSELEALFALPSITKKLIESVRIFVKADAEYAASIINTKLNAFDDNLYFRIKVVDYNLSAAQQLISEKPLFAPCISDGDKETNLVVFGGGKVTEKIVTETLACTSMGKRFSPSITVIDDNADVTEGIIKSSCAALFDEKYCKEFKIKKPVFFSCPLNHPLMCSFVSGKSAEHGITGMDIALKKGNYFVVATDNDKFNIEFAKKLRSWLLMTNDSFDRLPVIAVLIKNSYISEAAEKLEVGGSSQGSSWYDNYNLFCFGQNRKIYSAKNLIDNTNDKRAEFIHCSYCFSAEDKGLPDSDSIHESLVSFYRNYYNQDSSLCTALSLPYRLFAENLKLSNIDDYSDPDSSEILYEMSKAFNASDSALDSLAQTEHHRWVLFMLSRGWRKATKEQFVNYKRRGVPKQQCFLCKLHPYLADWSMLDKIHESLLASTLEEFAKSSLSNPKDYNKVSLLRTFDFLKNYDLFKSLNKETENQRS